MTTIQSLMANPKAVLSINEAAQVMTCDPRTVSRGIHDQTIPCITVGRRKLIPTRPFLKMLGYEI